MQPPWPGWLLDALGTSWPRSAAAAAAGQAEEVGHWFNESGSHLPLTDAPSGKTEGVLSRCGRHGQTSPSGIAPNSLAQWHLQCKG